MNTTVAVLLGAGSSRDAGLPLTNELAKRLVEQVNAQAGDVHEVNKALNFVYGAMVNHDSQQGKNPLAAVNVERLFSAVRLLRSRFDHEAAPFVTTWNQAIANLDRPLSPHSDRDVMRVIASHLEGRSSGDDLTRMIRSIANPKFASESYNVFAKLNDVLVQRTCRILNKLDSVEYLRPLADLAMSQSGGLTIATLNYDLAIETLGESVGVQVNTGVDGWEAGYRPRFSADQGSINLLKLHGSIDWSWEEAARESTDFRRISTTVIRQIADPTHNRRPVMVIGDREKLETEGPTLALLAAFEHSLEHVDRLVVVGYSFADDHVNRIITGWLNGEDDRKLVVLDPGWPANNHFSRHDYRAQLHGLATSKAGWPYSADSPVRVSIIRKTTADGLAIALSETPDAPTISVQALICHDVSGDTVLRLTNRGSEFREVALFVDDSDHLHDMDGQAIEWLSGPGSMPDDRGTMASAAEFGTFPTDGVISIVVRTSRHTAGKIGRLTFRGIGAVETFDRSFEFSFPD